MTTKGAQPPDHLTGEEEYPGQAHPLAPLDSRVWIPIRDGDPRALRIFNSHYSATLFGKNRGDTTRFVGPGHRIVLLTPDCRSLFVWRRFVEQGQEEPRGINCAVFHREPGPWLASRMILAAEHFARTRWPGERLYTYVAPWKVRSDNPGFCFKVAGWTYARTTPKGLLELEKFPPGRGLTGSPRQSHPGTRGTGTLPGPVPTPAPTPNRR